MATADHTTTALVAPCPSWCTEPTGHPFDAVGGSDSVEVFRYHHSLIGMVGPTAVSLMSEEQLVDGTPAASGAYVDLEHHAGSPLTAGDVDRLAEILRRAAAQLRSIEGA